MSGRLVVVVAWLAVRASLNLNYVFDPAYAWRLGQPFFLRNRRH